MTILIIAEKAKAAESLAKAFGNYNIINAAGRIKIYKIASPDAFIIPLRGHIMEYRTVKNIENWNSCDPRNILTDPSLIVKTPISYSRNYISLLRTYAKKTTKCIISTDADVEGCTIGLMDALPFVKKSNSNILVEQVWLNDLRPSTIRKAFASTIAPRWSWAYAGEARAKIDALIGFSATREVTLSLKPILKKLNMKIASIGRVQTSLLYLIFKKERVIRNFKPQPYYKINAILLHNHIEFKVAHTQNPFDKSLKSEAESIYNRIKNERFAVLTDVKVKNVKISPPNPLNTSSALQLITRHIKVSAKKALSILEDLYLDRLLSYPRTDTDRYPDNYDHKSIIKQALTTSEFSSAAMDILKRQNITPRNGKVDAGDHPPITPIRIIDINSGPFKSNLHKRIYRLIVQHYLAMFGNPAIERHINIEVSIGGEIFKGRFSGLNYPGFYEICPALKRKNYDSAELVNFNWETIGNHGPINIPVKNIDFITESTKPPAHFTETELLRLMERLNLGTKSTRPEIIEILIIRSYISRNRGSRTLTITEFGYVLMENLEKIWPEFLKPDYTANIEKMLEDIKKGNLNWKYAVERARLQFLSLFDSFRNNKKIILTSMLNTISHNAGNQTPVKSGGSSELTSANCPKCRQSPMKLITNGKSGTQFLKCTNPSCNNILYLPKRGKAKILKGQCKLCGFNIIRMDIYNGNKKSKYYLCPICFNRSFNTENKDSGQIFPKFCSLCPTYTIKRGRCISKADTRSENSKN